MRGRLIMVFSIFLFFLVLLIASFSYPVKAKTFPIIALSFGLVFTIIQIFRDLSALKEEGHPKEKGPPKEAGTDIETEIKIGPKHLAIGAWMVITPLMLFVLGFMATVILFPFIYLLYYRESPLLYIVLPISCAIFFYLLFGMFLGTPFYPGLLFSFIFG